MSKFLPRFATAMVAALASLVAMPTAARAQDTCIQLDAGVCFAGTPASGVASKGATSGPDVIIPLMVAGFPVGLEHDGSGGLLGTTIAGSSLLRLNAATGAQTQPALALSQSGNSIGVTTDGTFLYITDTSGGEVDTYDMSGNYIGSFSVLDLTTFPEGITYDPTSGSLFVVSGSSSHVGEYSGGVLINTWAVNGFSVDGIAYHGPSDTFIIYDSGTDTIRQYDRSFTEVDSWSADHGGGEGVAVIGGSVYVMFFGASEIGVYQDILPTLVYGDVDDNTTFDLRDLMSFVQLVRANGTMPYPAAVNPAADVTGDGNIDIIDFLFMLLRAQNTITCWPRDGGCVIPAPYDRFVGRKSAEAPVFAWGTAHVDGTTAVLPLEFVSGDVAAFYVEIPAGEGYRVDRITSKLPADWKLSTLDVDGAQYFLGSGESTLEPGSVVEIGLQLQQGGVATIQSSVTDLLGAATQALSPVTIQAEVPEAFSLLPSYPNPFNPSTNVSFTVPESASVRLAVYDVMGREVAVLVDEVRSAGTHQVQFTAGSLPSGTYLMRFSTPGGSFTQTLNLVK